MKNNNITVPEIYSSLNVIATCSLNSSFNAELVWSEVLKWNLPSATSVICFYS